MIARLFDALFSILTEISCPSSKTTNGLVSPQSDAISPTLSSDTPSMPKHGPTNGLKMGGAKRGPKKAGNIRTQGKSHGHATKIDILPDDVLLEIFASIRSSRTLCEIRKHPVWEWHILVHVCRRWRQLIFALPLHLDLQLLCTYGTPVRKSLGCWPSFPLVVDYSYHPEFGDDPRPLFADEEDSILAALEQRDRVRHVDLSVWYLDLGTLITVMEEPFPALTHLRLTSQYLDGPVTGIPNEFLGGSAPPGLREITLSRIPIPELPPLISSAGSLVELRLEDIDPESIPTPEAVIACLTTLTRLEYFSLKLLKANSRPSRSPLPETRVLLPTLTSFLFQGLSTYLEEFVAQIHTPQLNLIDIQYLCGDFHFQFGHAKIYVEHDSKKVSFEFYPKINLVPTVAIQIRSITHKVYAQVMGLALFLKRTPTMLSDVVRLEIEAAGPEEREDKSLHSIRWLDLFHPFTALETLRVSSRFAKSVAEGIAAGMATDTQVLPALNSIVLEGVHAKTKEGLCAAFRARDRSLAIASSEKCSTSNLEWK